MPEKISGTLEVITGCMFSGKTSEYIKRLRLAMIQQKFNGFKKKVQSFKPSNDVRYSEDDVVSHDGSSLKAELIPIDNPWRIIELLDTDTVVVGIEEAQFFSGSIVCVVNDLMARGIRVIVAGLKLDSRNNPFGSMPELLVMADKIDMLTDAICATCGRPATRTQRKLDSEFAGPDSPQVVVAGEDVYQPACSQCHVPA
jgi:thymidine kinase